MTQTAQRPLLKVLHLTPMPIFQQLQIEEALLRAGKGNWCLINHGSPPAIVMGLSGKVDEDLRLRPDIPVIRRFSGGGTVVVDEDTLFFTLIFDQADLCCLPNPVDVLAWTGKLLSPVFAPLTLCIEGQDYVIEGRKIGGNAQSFSCGRVLHHTSFLWSWTQERMGLLSMPRLQPAYRNHRTHSDFCNKLSRYFPAKNGLIEAMQTSLAIHFDCTSADLSQIHQAVQTPHRKALELLSI
jgi:lipoate---protein ligase